LTHISSKADGHVCQAPKEAHFTCHVWSGRRRGMVQLSTGPTVHRPCIKLMKPKLAGRVTAVRISYIMPISLRIRHTRCSLQRRPSFLLFSKSGFYFLSLSFFLMRRVYRERPRCNTCIERERERVSVRDMTPSVHSEEKAQVKVYLHRGVRLVGCNVGR
jgi:hypothetical protein